MSLHGYSLPRSPLGRGEPRPVAAVALRRRLPRDRLLGRPGRRRGGPARRRRSAPGRRRPLLGAVRRLAVVQRRRRGAGRPVALAVQGVLPRRQRAGRRRGRDDLPVHLGRPGLRARARLDPGLSEEARRDLDHAQVRPRQRGRAGARARRALRRQLLGARPPHRRGADHADRRERDRRPAQRRAAGERALLSAAGRRPPRRAGRPRAGAGEVVRPLGDAGMGGRRRAGAVRRARRGAHGAGAGQESARATASPSPTRSTTWSRSRI